MRCFGVVDPFPIQVNELLIGNVDGVLAIFKGDVSSKPWKKCSELGTVRKFNILRLSVQSYMAKHI